MGYRLKVLKLGKKILFSKKSLTPIVESLPQKTKTFYDLPESDELNKSNEYGKNKKIQDFIRAVREDDFTALHSIVVLKNGEKIGEHYEEPYKKGDWHATFSASKTVTALAIGILVDQKKLTVDDKVVEILHPKKYGYKPKEYQKTLTVLDLLTMNSRVDFVEAHAITNKNWLKGYMRAKLKKSGFNYNSLNSYLLSVIVKEKSGQNLSKFLDENLFTYLGIKRYFWETDEKKIEKGGWGLYLTTEDLAKLGQLVAWDGKWKGRQLISKTFIDEMINNLRLTPKNYGKYNYGYHIWHHEDKKIYLFNGLMGQNVFILPEEDLVVAVNSGSGSVFQRAPIYGFVERYLVSGEEYISKITGEKEESVVFGGVYEYNVEGARKVGLLPAVQAIFQNNYSKGITGFKLDTEKGEFTLLGEDQVIPISFREPREFIFSKNGEKYVCRSTIKVDGNTVTIKVHFVETPVVKIFDITFGGKIWFTHRETPGFYLIENAKKTLFIEKSKVRKILNLRLVNKKIKNFLQEKIEIL